MQITTLHKSANIIFHPKSHILKRLPGIQDDQDGHPVILHPCNLDLAEHNGPPSFFEIFFADLHIFGFFVLQHLRG
jgi:hypothetical protein